MFRHRFPKDSNVLLRRLQCSLKKTPMFSEEECMLLKPLLQRSFFDNKKALHSPSKCVTLCRPQRCFVLVHFFVIYRIPNILCQAIIMEIVQYLQHLLIVIYYKTMLICVA